LPFSEFFDIFRKFSAAGIFSRFSFLKYNSKNRDFLKKVPPHNLNKINRLTGKDFNTPKAKLPFAISAPSKTWVGETNLAICHFEEAPATEKSYYFSQRAQRTQRKM